MGQVVVAGWHASQPAAVGLRRLLLLLLLPLQQLLLLQVRLLATLHSRAATSVATESRTLSSRTSADH